MKKIFLVLLAGGLFVGCNSNHDFAQKEINTASVLPSFSTSHTTSSDRADDEVWLESLITETPQEGRELAIKMARKTIGAIQSDGDVKKKLRGEYAQNAELLILSAEVVAIEFRTVAEANNYWRK